MRKAFTLIELLVTIAIITILMSILFAGGSAIINGARAKRTTVALDNAANMLAELDSSGGMNTNNVAGWLIHDASGSRTHITVGDFWKSGLPVCAPGNVQEYQPDRDFSVATVNTALAMDKLAKIPANLSAMNKIPTDDVYILRMHPNSPNPQPQPTSPGADRTPGTADDGTETPNYPAGISALHNFEKTIYQASSGGAPYSVPADGTPPPTPPWRKNFEPAPLLLDGWGNPIIFVPSTGLVVRLKGNENDYNTHSSSTNITRVITSAGAYDPDASTVIIPTGARPFWASAGPDGNFWMGDDNIYSFGN